MRVTILIPAALGLLVSVSRALAEPVPVRMVGTCPAGYVSGADWCVPMPDTTREAVQRFGQCPSGWVHSGAYCLGPEKPQAQGLMQMLQDWLGARGW